MSGTPDGDRPNGRGPLLGTGSPAHAPMDQFTTDAPLAPTPAHFFVGVDVASETLAVALTKGPARLVAGPVTFANDPDGFDALATWLGKHGAHPQQALVCMEATGVYGEALCYWLHGHGYGLAVEDPARVQRAMPVAGAKTDAADARRIADYAARFLDELRPWSPSEAVVEQVQTLLSMREQLVREVGAKRNVLHVLRRKVVQTPLAIRIADDALAYLKAHAKQIDSEVRRLVSAHPTIGPAVTLLLSVPGVNHLLAAPLTVDTSGFTEPLVAKRFAAYIGICPLEHTSGTSVRRRSRSRGYGPSGTRKLLYLASMRLMQKDGSFAPYYVRKVGEGKSGRLVLNNLSEGVED